MRKKIGTVLTIAFILTITCSNSVLAFPQYLYLDNTDKIGDICEPRADDIAYQYKVINGVLYKRLYNFTTQKPLSGWVKA